MCIRDSVIYRELRTRPGQKYSKEDLIRSIREIGQLGFFDPCLLYTSDAADERSSVDLGGRRIIKKKTDIAHGGGHETSIKQEDTNTIETRLYTNTRKRA